MDEFKKLRALLSLRSMENRRREYATAALQSILANRGFSLLITNSEPDGEFIEKAVQMAWKVADEMIRQEDAGWP